MSQFPGLWRQRPLTPVHNKIFQDTHANVITHGRLKLLKESESNEFYLVLSLLVSQLVEELCKDLLYF
jgi:hypothetical protein